MTTEIRPILGPKRALGRGLSPLLRVLKGGVATA